MICKNCNTEIDNKTTICPKCGTKIKKPWYKKIWIWVLVGLFLIIIGANSNTENIEQPENINEVITEEKKQNTEEQNAEKEQTKIVYENFIPTLQNLCNSSGMTNYTIEFVKDESLLYYHIKVSEKGLCDSLTTCALNNDFSFWYDLVNATNVSTKTLKDFSNIAGYNIPVRISYYDTNGTIMLDSMNGESLYDAKIAVFGK